MPAFLDAEESSDYDSVQKITLICPKMRKEMVRDGSITAHQKNPSMLRGSLRLCGLRVGEKLNESGF